MPICPASVLLFFVCDTEFFFARMGEKKLLGPFLAPKPFFF